MVTKQVGTVVGVTAVGSDNLGDEFNDTDLGDLTAMRARLTAIDGTLYSAANLDKMTWNDMVYAIRVNDAAATVG